VTPAPVPEPRGAADGSTWGAGTAALGERVRAEIRARGPLTFARFMELALYDDEAGYYMHGASRLGPRGDYVTASDAGREFGRAVARQIRELDRAVGPFHPFHYVEFGAGRGLLARDVLDAARELDPELAARLRPTLVDRSPSMRAEAARRVPEARVVAEGPRAAGDGLVFAVELLDALPVHRVRRRGGRLVELLVAEGPRGALVEVEGDPGPEVLRLAERYGAAPGEGDEAEVTLALEPVVDRLLDALERGLVIAVDYGDRAPELYGPGRSRGTLLAYRAQRTSLDCLAEPGAQDLTAHVNFSLVEDRARARGAAVAAFTTQDRFLIANGILEAFAAADEPAWRRPSAVKRRLQALSLIHPERMGRAFKVLALARGLPALDLRGLADPFAR
jgi:SAM-dependent MidA family methyltransferase